MVLDPKLERTLRIVLRELFSRAIIGGMRRVGAIVLLCGLRGVEVGFGVSGWRVIGMEVLCFGLRRVCEGFDLTMKNCKLDTSMGGKNKRDNAALVGF